MEAPRRSPRVDVDHSGGRLHYLSRPGPRTERTHTRTPLPLRPWTGIRKSGVVDSSLCQGVQKVLIPVPERRQQKKMEGRFLRGQFIYDVHNCAIIYQIREGGVGVKGWCWGKLGAGVCVGSIHGTQSVCGLWFVNEHVGLVRMRRCVIEPCPALTFSLRTLLSSPSRCCLPPKTPRALRFPSPDRRCEK